MSSKHFLLEERWVGTMVFRTRIKYAAAQKAELVTIGESRFIIAISTDLKELIKRTSREDIRYCLKKSRGGRI